MGRVDGKVAIVTGGASGIGKASCLLLAKEGAKVAVADINDEAGKKVVSEIEGDGGVAQYWHVNVSDEKEVAQAFQDIYGKFGKIDVMVNNAGIRGIEKPTDEINTGEWEKVINVNLKGVFLCTKHVAPYMKKGGGGSIINISSILGLIGGQDPPYHAAKGGVRSITKSDAFYYGKNGIRVNSIHPGFILTPMVEDMMPKTPEEAEEHAKMLEAIMPLGHMGEPNDIAFGILYLASDESKFVTGEELVIDGGFASQ